MSKKSIIIISGMFIIAIGALASFRVSRKSSQPAAMVPIVKPTDENKPAKQSGDITYLVSKEDKTKFCNGGVMDSDGYRKTITTKVTSDVPKDGLTETELAKETAVLATDGMCQEALKRADFKISDGAVEISPIAGWAGISIAMCSCQPEVEVNLLRISGIKKVIWLSN